MSDTASDWELSRGPFARQDSPREAPPREEPPQFGAVDIVDAFTAMRHEWRGQTKESLALAEQIQRAVATLQSLEEKVLARHGDAPPEEPGASKQLAQLVVETDHQLARGIAALSQWEAARSGREAAEAKAVEQYFAGMSGLSRWFARPLLRFVEAQRPVAEPAARDPAVEGLYLVLARLRRAMSEHGIERIDTEGEAFDANTMHAIGTVAAADCPPGHVAEQLTPAYRWQGRMLRYADVRVAR